MKMLKKISTVWIGFICLGFGPVTQALTEKQALKYAFEKLKEAADKPFVPSKPRLLKPLLDDITPYYQELMNLRDEALEERMEAQLRSIQHRLQIFSTLHQKSDNLDKPTVKWMAQKMAEGALLTWAAFAEDNRTLQDEDFLYLVMVFCRITEWMYTQGGGVMNEQEAADTDEWIQTAFVSDEFYKHVVGVLIKMMHFMASEYEDEEVSY